MPGQVHILQQRIEHTIGAEDRLPRIRSHQITDPQRNDHQLIEQIFSLACIERQEIRQRISQQQRKQHHARRNPHRAQQRLPVHRLLQQFFIVLEIPRVHDGLRRRDRPEAVAEHQQIRHQQKHCYPHQRRHRHDRLVERGRTSVPFRRLAHQDRIRGRELQFHFVLHSATRSAVRTTSTSPSAHSTRINSVAP